MTAPVLSVAAPRIRLGPQGASTHDGRYLAVALGREAVRQGYSVLFTPAMALMTDLKAQAEGRLEEKLTRYAKPKLLILRPRVG